MRRKVSWLHSVHGAKSKGVSIDCWSRINFYAKSLESHHFRFVIILTPPRKRTKTWQIAAFHTVQRTSKHLIFQSTHTNMLTMNTLDANLVNPSSPAVPSFSATTESFSDTSSVTIGRGNSSLLENEASVSKQSPSASSATMFSVTPLPAQNPTRKRNHPGCNRLDLSNVRERIVEGITMMETGQLSTATSLFERAGTNLMVHFMVHVQNNPPQPELNDEVSDSTSTRPSKRPRTSSCPKASPQTQTETASSSPSNNDKTPQYKPIFFAPFFRPDTPSGSPFVEPSFNYPFTFVALESDSVEKQVLSSSQDQLHQAAFLHKLQHQEMAAYTATVIFNLGLCNHLHPRASEQHLETAIQHYRRAWNSANESSPPSRQSTMLVIQMAVTLNLSDCFYRLGRLDDCHEWITTLKETILPCARKHSCISDSLVDFFEKAATTRTRCIAAGAA